jgi:phosphatidylserine/phosphatidylglycerophosphate/cardiolipin synthase-like enzyme
MIARRNSLLAATLLAICWAGSLRAQQIESYFSPRDGSAAAMVRHLSQARATIDVAAYQFSYRPLTDALIMARQRGVVVRVILDRRIAAEDNPEPLRLRAAGIPIVADQAEPLHHNKYAVIDAAVTITGSQNWSNNGENRNAENTVIISHGPTAAAFAADFQKHWRHSVPFIPKRLPRKQSRTQPPYVPFLPSAAHVKEFLSWLSLPVRSIPTPLPANSPEAWSSLAGKDAPASASW